LDYSTDKLANKDWWVLTDIAEETMGNILADLTFYRNTDNVGRDSQDNLAHTF
jgi:hypothetical protein